MEISPGLNNLCLNSLNSFFLKPTGHRRSRTYARVLIIIFHPNRVCMQHGGTKTLLTHTREGFTGNISKMWRRNWHWHVPECNSKVISYWTTDKSDLLNFYFYFFCTEFVIVRVKSTSEKQCGMFRASPATDRCGAVWRLHLAGTEGNTVLNSLHSTGHTALFLELVAKPECIFAKSTLYLAAILDRPLFCLYFHNSWHSVQK